MKLISLTVPNGTTIYLNPAMISAIMDAPNEALEIDGEGKHCVVFVNGQSEPVIVTESAGQIAARLVSISLG